MTTFREGEWGKLHA